MSHPYKGYSENKTASRRAKNYQDGGAVPKDRDRLRKRGEWNLYFRTGSPIHKLSNYQLGDQQKMDREETMDISRKVRRNLPYSDD